MKAAIVGKMFFSLLLLLFQLVKLFFDFVHI